MKLPTPHLDADSSLQEFDVWITPTLGEIRDTKRFKREMQSVVQTFDALGKATEYFEQVESCDPEAIAETFVQSMKGESEASCRDKLESLASVLFLVTGKSDNNAKCQLPIHLQQKVRWSELPVVKSRGNGPPKLMAIGVPRVLDSQKYMGIIATLGSHPDIQKKLLHEFVRFILSDGRYVSQLWSIGHSYFMLKALKRETDLLSPLVVFQVRGSVAASGGHDPEELLRARLAEWGLQRDVDYNINDVVLRSTPQGASTPVEIEEIPTPGSSEEQSQLEETAIGADETDTKKGKEKTRAYDFVLPFRTPSWMSRVFIQSQFYAGDSGSVSHKNVDQTTTSRKSALEKFPEARFVEYVDGAGYFSSLNGDLKKLLQMDTTKSFFQVRSAPVRLRRELQEVGFLTPLEIHHAIVCSDGSMQDVRRLLTADGYSEKEVDRSVEDSVKRGFVASSKDAKLEIPTEKRDLARKYLLMDVACREGKTLDNRENLKGHFLVPGYGPFYGLPLDELAAKAGKVAPALREIDWAKGPEVILHDVRWLCEQGFAMTGP